MRRAEIWPFHSTYSQVVSIASTCSTEDRIRRWERALRMMLIPLVSVLVEAGDGGAAEGFIFV
ncbi:MAG: hypothetical protein P8M20_01670, partial [Planctomycetaceae bacterium]|nr:hypothetical protein [Planctomycetaceae bacterium]